MYYFQVLNKRVEQGVRLTQSLAADENGGNVSLGDEMSDTQVCKPTHRLSGGFVLFGARSCSSQFLQDALFYQNKILVHGHY